MAEHGPTGVDEDNKPLASGSRDIGQWQPQHCVVEPAPASCGYAVCPSFCLSVDEHPMILAAHGMLQDFRHVSCLEPRVRGLKGEDYT